MKKLMLGACALALVACSQEKSADAVGHDDPAAGHDVAGDEAAAPVLTPWEKLAVVLDAQSDADKARYTYRHPQETLEFFGVKPGMTVVDTLPGNVWYSGILIDYLGPEGKVVGADYSPVMWSKFGNYAPPAGAKDNWATEWTATAESWRDNDGDAGVGALAFGAAPDEMAGSVDVILQIRALHHFNRFEDDGGYMSAALGDMMMLLKPGGVVGVVQHRAPEGNADEWANGDNGYLKQSQVIAAFGAAGFELADTSEINANPKDQPTTDDFVWRLPPALVTSKENEEMKAQMTAIGETDRMTLKFRKPE